MAILAVGSLEPSLEMELAGRYPLLREPGAEVTVCGGRPGVDAALRPSDNVVLLPHMGSATARTCDAMARLAGWSRR